MKYIKKFNEAIKNKDIQETIDEILDKLSKSGELSKSEKEFMDEASNGTITNITTPNKTGNFWADISNPHNSGILWMGKNKVWKSLKSLEDEELDKISNIENSDERWKKQIEYKINKFSKELPELKSILNEYAIDLLEVETKYNKVVSNYTKKLINLTNNKDQNLKYDFKQKINGSSNMDSLDKLFDRFGSLIDKVVFDDEDGEYKIKK